MIILKNQKNRGFTPELNVGSSLVQIKNNKLVRGFTLVESLVAIGILSLSVLATFTAVQSGLQNSTLSKDQTIAFYLIQEGMEYIKNIRDENALKNIDGTATNWLSGLADSSDPCFTGLYCSIDSPNKQVVACGSIPNTCPNLRQDPATGMYGHTGTWNLTNFNRQISFSPISADEVLVTIKVGWVTRGQNKSFEVTETLFNRQ